jgi:RimJ/RimL family protein N-acetyltransferase
VVGGGRAALDPRQGDARALTEIPRFDDLSTDGVVTLRAFRDGDVPAIVEACRDPEVVRWTRVPDPYDADDAREYLALAERNRESGGALGAAIADARSGEYLGSIELRVSEREGRGDIGYFVAPSKRGHGFAARAVRLLAGHAFERLGLGRVEIVVHPDNAASQRVAEQAGFAREAVLRSYIRMRDGHHDGVMFSRVPTAGGSSARRAG